jgi:hypothetical protein
MPQPRNHARNPPLRAQIKRLLIALAPAGMHDALHARIGQNRRPIRKREERIREDARAPGKLASLRHRKAA